MKDRDVVKRPLVLLTIAVVFSAGSFGQTARTGSTVVDQLLPNGNPHSLSLPKPAARNGVIKRLKAIQNDPKKPQAQQVAFLLAVLDVDYEHNRDFLLRVFKGCDSVVIQRGCDDMTGEYLAYLYEHGHAELLKPLMVDGAKSYNAAGSEFVGDFLSHIVARSTNDFISAIRSLAVPEQKKVCQFAGSADGGGMNAKDLANARKMLKAMNDPVATRCLREIERANSLN